MNIVVWAMRWLLGIYWLAVGVVHFIIPPGLPAPMSWMYELSPELHATSGTLEILGGLELLLPALFKRAVFLVPLAALGLAGVMGAAMIWHVQHESFAQTGPLNITIAVIMLFIAWGRWKLRPHTPRVQATAPESPVRA